MTSDEWIRTGEFALSVHDAQVRPERRSHFRAVEIAPVGRQRFHPAQNRIVTLQAPTPKVFATAIILIDLVLEWVRAFDGAAPVAVSSWYRDEAYNSSIPGAARNSMHSTGGAADITKVGWTSSRLALALHQHPRSRDLGIGVYDSFVHVDIRGILSRQAPARWGMPATFWP